MKLIIAGGRNFNKQNLLFININEIAEEITEVISGTASGADDLGEQWAYWQEIPVKLFPANWEKYGRSAGPIRNKQMAQYADAIALFPGGKGTNNMYITAKKHNLKIYDFRNI